jgi:hypothetical protein
MLTFTMVNQVSTTSNSKQKLGQHIILNIHELAKRVWRNTGYELAFTRYQDTAANRGNDAVDKLAKEAVSLVQVHEFYPLVST